MHSFALLTAFVCLCMSTSVLTSPVPGAPEARGLEGLGGLKARKIPGGYEIPFKRTKGKRVKIDTESRGSGGAAGNGKRAKIDAESRVSGGAAGNARRGLKKAKRVNGETGLGDNSDLLYTVPVEIGGIVTAAHLDTGSSDLWLTSDACTSTSCNGAATATRLTTSSLNLSDTQVTMQFGDSTTGSVASGPIGSDTATVAGIAIEGQSFAAVSSTTNNVVKYGAAGIFGLSFPAGSKIQEALVENANGGSFDADKFVSGTEGWGPLLARIAMTGALDEPLFAIELQRNTVDVGGQDGVLTVGRLPDGVDNSSLTWVPVRLYAESEGGLTAPSFAPNEVYPFRWEIPIDGVFLDGQKVADSSIPANGVSEGGQTALIDTGNSLLRGPSDVVSSILSSVSTTYDPSRANSAATLPCDVPHTLAYQIGGKMFPIDPRDFIGDASNNVQTCVADNLVATDPPSRGALFRWSLGDPFMKSNLVAFHYGNLTHPSVDPPRIGFLSMVPQNADDLLTQAVDNAEANGGAFASTVQVAPTASAATADQITVSAGFSGSVTTRAPDETSVAGATSTQTSPVTVTMGSGSGDSGSGSDNDNNAAAGLIAGSRSRQLAVVVGAVGVGLVLGW